MWLIGAYIPPVTSRWQGWTDVEPIQQLWETVALCTPNSEKPVLLLTDINGRTGSQQVESFEEAWPRNSSDPTENSRGRAILEECEKYGLCILNGTSLETTSPGRFTSHQPRGKSTIDYGFVSEALLPLVRNFHVECPTPDPKDDWADHTRICVTLDAAAITRTTVPVSVRQSMPNFTCLEDIDRLYQATMDARETPDKALNSIYGPVLSHSPPIHIYVEGAAPGPVRTKSAGAGICFGIGSALNACVKVPGPGKPTADRGRIFAIHEALQKVEPDQTLVIFCTSKMVIRQLCYAAAKKMAIGWPGPNGDLFKDTVLLLGKRHGRTTFVHVESKAKNDRKQEAYSLAKAALEVPQSVTLFEPAAATTPKCNKPHDPIPNMGKVVTDLEETSPERPKPWKD
jgi:hypothetical protein